MPHANLAVLVTSNFTAAFRVLSWRATVTPATEHTRSMPFWAGDRILCRVTTLILAVQTLPRSIRGVPDGDHALSAPPPLERR